MIALLAMLLGAGPISGMAAVNAVRIQSVENRTEVVIEVDGPVSVGDFSLGSPDRVVVDIKGARRAAPEMRYTALDRGGIVGLRASQYTEDVVRVVLELSGPVDYRVRTDSDGVHVSFPNSHGPFEPWSSASTDAATPAPAAGRPVDSAAPAARRTSAVAPAAEEPAQQPEPHITVTFENTPILDVIQTFAAFANRSIVAGSDVTGNVTADIHDQPWDLALEAILESHGFSVTERRSGILQVVDLEQVANREKVEELVTRQFRINYASVDSIVPAIQGLLSDRGRVTTNPATNTLIVTDGRTVVERIAPVIRDLDVRTPQVTIAAKIIFVDRTALQDLGVVYDLKDSRGTQLNTVVQGYQDENGDGVYEPGEATNQDVILLGGNSVAALANANDRVSSASLRLVSTLLLGRHSLITFLEALQSLQLTDIQAAPVVTVLDNRQASLQVGEDTPVRIIDLGANTGGGSNTGATVPRATVTFKKTGVILQVTPHVTGDQVLLEVHAERSNIAAAPSDLGVTFQTQASDTQVLVDDGETAVIAALTVINKSKSRTGIPLLMNLPFIGRLFSTTHDKETKQDLLIMVTPHIVRAGR